MGMLFFHSKNQKDRRNTDKNKLLFDMDIEYEENIQGKFGGAVMCNEG